MTYVTCRDEDMQSMASLMSTPNNNDIAALEDFDEDEEKESMLECFFLSPISSEIADSDCQQCL